MPASEPIGSRSGSRRAWGWHPLVDEWAGRVVADASVRPGELVIDVGAGTGALTRHLLLAGARVLAVELHPGRAQSLRERFPDATVLELDIFDFRWPRRPFKVVANPPYALTSALMRTLLACDSHLVAADLVLQRAAVRRFIEFSAAPTTARSSGGSRSTRARSAGTLSSGARSDPRRSNAAGSSKRSSAGQPPAVRAAEGSPGGRAAVRSSTRRWLLQPGLSLPRRAFRPPPQVDSAVLMVRRR